MPFQRYLDLLAAHAPGENLPPSDVTRAISALL
jgi:hypothetical protein